MSEKHRPTGTSIEFDLTRALTERNNENAALRAEVESLKADAVILERNADPTLREACDKAEARVAELEATIGLMREQVPYLTDDLIEKIKKSRAPEAK